MKRILVAFAGLLLLAGCVPGATNSSSPAENRVIIVNGPRENSVPGLADALESEMRRTAECCEFDIQWSQPVRAQERQRDMYDYRAFISTGSIARNLRAGWALMVSANGYEREVTEVDERLHIDVTAGVTVYVTDDQGQELARFDSRIVQASRQQPASQQLASEYHEPLLQQLTGRVLPEVAAPAVDFLNELAAD